MLMVVSISSSDFVIQEGRRQKNLNLNLDGPTLSPRSPHTLSKSVKQKVWNEKFETKSVKRKVCNEKCETKIVNWKVWN